MIYLFHCMIRSIVYYLNEYKNDWVNNNDMYFHKVQKIVHDYYQIDQATISGRARLEKDDLVIIR